VLRVDGFAVRIYTLDHEPPHVHVVLAGTVVVIHIDDGYVREVEGMKPRDVARAVHLVDAHREHLLTQWRRIHG
jgi:hypothetical protein